MSESIDEYEKLNGVIFHAGQNRPSNGNQMVVVKYNSAPNGSE